ncbi:MAG: ribokinase [Roseburia sp.]|nr:ribokinase [Roseburia sp.]
MKKIVVIGSLNMDLITQTEKLPVMGETISGIAFKTVCGGKGGNQACAAAKLGGNVTMLGCVGEDVFGQELLACLEKVGVDCSKVRICEGMESGTASITVYQGDNSIIIIPGANGVVSIEYIEEHLSCIKEADFIMLQLEIPLETVEYIISYAAKEKIPVMLNPAPAKELPDTVFRQTEYMIVNETECEFYTGVSIHTIEEAKEGLRHLRAKGIQNGIVTLGSQGAVFNCGDEIFHEPAKKVTAVDSTAAGDTFTAAIVVSLLEGNTMQEAIKFATKASAIVVTRMGAQTSIPSRDEL